jgi:hypothetical protein
MVKGDRYKGGIRPLCLNCHNIYSNLIYRKKAKNYSPRVKKSEEFKVTTEGLLILIKNGFARNEEEARMYLAK